jgi:hypothetical protein
MVIRRWSLVSICVMIFVVHVAKVQSSKVHNDIYSDGHGSKIEFRSDSTFLHTYRFDMISSWSSGKWSVKNDTVFLTMIPVYDTVKVFNKNGAFTHYDKAKADSPIPKMQVRHDGVATASTGKWQNYLPTPPKLYLKNGRLYNVDEKGNPIQKKVFNEATGNKQYTYYTKQ